MKGHARSLATAIIPSLFLFTFPVSAQNTPTKACTRQAATPVPKFVDVTAPLGVHFRGQAAHTSRKYLIETMGSGVALFDYDNDGRLDIFAVNGAPLSDPTQKGAVPQKTEPQYWNR